MYIISHILYMVNGSPAGFLKSEGNKERVSPYLFVLVKEFFFSICVKLAMVSGKI